MSIEQIKNNPILKHAFDLSLMVDAYCVELYQQKHYDLARQLFRAGTSVGANVFEAQHAESKSDFIHKMKIASKEAAETYFWLMHCKMGNHYPDCDRILEKLLEVNKLLTAIISTSRRNILSTYCYLAMSYLAKWIGIEFIH